MLFLNIVHFYKEDYTNVPKYKDSWDYVNLATLSILNALWDKIAIN